MVGRCHLLAVAVLLVAASPGQALVDPKFTPVHLCNQSESIWLVAARAAAGQPAVDDNAKRIKLDVTEVIKGKAEAAVKQITIDLTSAAAGQDGADSVKEFVAIVKDRGRRPGLLFVPAKAAQRPNVLLHVDVHWFRCQATEQGQPDTIVFDRRDHDLNATFNGSTEMLAATARFIQRFPHRPIMAADCGVKWSQHTKVGQMPGKSAAPAVAIKVLDINGDGRLDLFAASPDGDQVFLAGDKGEFKVLPGLASASLAADWADFDGDGRPDLASLGKNGLTLYLQTEPGKFKAVPVDGVGKPETLSPTVWAVDLAGDGRPSLVVGARGLPTVLRNVGGGKFEKIALTTTQPDLGELGPPGPCVVADFDGDGRPDIVQTFAKDGLLFRGQDGGTFAPGVPCGAAMGPVKERTACLADLTGDGRLCLLLAGGGAKPVAYTFVGERFESITRRMGEPSYIIQAGASFAAAGDVNNDGHLDLFVGYAAEPAQCFFNRGYRTFAAAEPLRLPSDEIEGANDGQTAAVFADLDGDGAVELITALSNGTIWVSASSISATATTQGVRVTLGSKCKSAGPVLVTVWTEGVCLGVRCVDSRFSPAMIGLPQAGEVVLKWRLPGQPERSSKIKLLDAVESLTIE